MTPLELRLKNFMSYRDEVVLDFRRLGIACFSGDNGAGKSALLDAITWAIWGKTRASSDRDVIALGATEMEVTFAFAMHEREFRIFRRRASAGAGRQSLEFAVRNRDTTDWLEITGDNVRQTERAIGATLNLDYDTFVHSAFILQGKADSFSQIGPTDRKRILAEILNLDEYDDLSQLARDDERNLRGQVEAANARLTAIERQLEELPERRRELEEIARSLVETSERLDASVALVNALASQASAWRQIGLALEQAMQRLQRVEAASAIVESDISRLNDELDTSSRLLEAAPDIEAGAEALERWRRESARYSEQLLQVRQLEQQRDTAQREIDRTANDLRRDIERDEARIRQLADSANRFQVEAGGLAQLRLDERAAAARLVRLDQLLAEVTVARDQRAELQAANGELRRKMEEIRENRDRIVSGVAVCPVCRAELSPEDRDRIAAEWQAEGTGLGDEFRENKRKIEELDALDRRLEKEEAELREVDRSRAAIVAQIRQAETTEGHLRELDAERQALNASVEPRRAQFDRNEFALESRVILSQAVQDIERVAYDQAAHDQAIAEERGHAIWAERKLELDRSRVQREGIQQRIIALSAQREHYREDRVSAKSDVEYYEAQLRDQPDLQQRYELALEERDRVELLRSDLQTRFGRSESALEALNRLADERDQLGEQARVVGLDAGAARELVQAFGSNGIQAMIVDSVLPELQDDANDILRRMSSGSLRVTFRSQREAVSADRMVETLDILIRDEFGERPYALYSGGEAFRINFAVRVALSKLLARRAGSKIDILVIDEGFGSQDARGRDGLLEALRSVETDFGTIIVITHLSEVRDLFPTRVEIVKTERGSTLTVVDR